MPLASSEEVEELITEALARVGIEIDGVRMEQGEEPDVYVIGFRATLRAEAARHLPPPDLDRIGMRLDHSEPDTRQRVERAIDGLVEQGNFHHPEGRGRGGVDYIVSGALRRIQRGVGPNAAFVQACEDENYYGTSELIVRGRKRAADILRDEFDVQISSMLVKDLGAHLPTDGS